MSDAVEEAVDVIKTITSVAVEIATDEKQLPHDRLQAVDRLIALLPYSMRTL